MATGNIRDIITLTLETTIVSIISDQHVPSNTNNMLYYNPGMGILLLASHADSFPRYIYILHLLNGFEHND